MKEIFGDYIFSSDFKINFQNGAVDLKLMEAKFENFIRSNNLITMDSWSKKQNYEKSLHTITFCDANN